MSSWLGLFSTLHFYRDILDKDKSDLEIVGFALGALINIFSEEIEDEELNIPADIGKYSLGLCIQIPISSQSTTG